MMKILQHVLLAASLLMSTALLAEDGSDRIFQKLDAMNAKAEAVLRQAEKSPANQRQSLMTQHMQMLDDIMATLHTQHPDASMTTEQHLAWMEQHDKLVDDVLAQMQREHQLMLQTCPN